MSLDDARAMGRALIKRFGGDDATSVAFGDIFAAAANGAQVKIQLQQFGSITIEMEFKAGKIVFNNISETEKQKIDRRD